MKKFKASHNTHKGSSINDEIKGGKVKSLRRFDDAKEWKIIALRVKRWGKTGDIIYRQPLGNKFLKLVLT